MGQNLIGDHTFLCVVKANLGNITNMERKWRSLMMIKSKYWKKLVHEQLTCLCVVNQELDLSTSRRTATEENVEEVDVNEMCLIDKHTYAPWTSTQYWKSSYTSSLVIFVVQRGRNLVLHSLINSFDLWSRIQLTTIVCHYLCISMKMQFN